MKKIFCILLAIIVAPMFLCSCGSKKQDFVNLGEHGVSEMVNRVKSQTEADKGGVYISPKHGGKSGKQLQKGAYPNARVTKNGVIYIKDSSVVNNTGKEDTNFSVGPLDIKFHTGDVRLQY